MIFSQKKEKEELRNWHGIRNRGEIKVRAFGEGAAWKSVKSLAIARKYIAATNQKMELSYSPAFIDAEIQSGTMNGVGFTVFATERDAESNPLNLDNVKDVLLVKRDSDDSTPEQKREAIRKLASAISHACLENGDCIVRAFGQYCVYKSIKALAMARGFVASKGPDLYVWNDFVVAEMNGSSQTGQQFYCFTNAN